MSVSLATLVAQLQADVPARNSVPSADQYEYLIKTAVADYSRRNPNQKIYALSIVSGTAAYSLPSDFLRVITLESAATADGVIISNAGIVPISALWDEVWTIAGLTITFSPTPTYSMDRDLWYAAGHVLNGSDAYPDMTEDDATILLMKARSLALGMQASAVAGDGWKYQIGDEMVDKSGQGKAFRDQAQHWEDSYLAAVKGAVGYFGLRGG